MHWCLDKGSRFAKVPQASIIIMERCYSKIRLGFISVTYNSNKAAITEKVPEYLYLVPFDSIKRLYVHISVYNVLFIDKENLLAPILLFKQNF